MTEAPQIQKDADLFQSKYDDEALDYKQYDGDDASTCEELYDNVDDDKIELAETFEKEIELINGHFQPNNQNYFNPYEIPNYCNNPIPPYYNPRNCFQNPNMLGFPNYAYPQWNKPPCQRLPSGHNPNIGKDSPLNPTDISPLLYPNFPSYNTPYFPQMNNFNDRNAYPPYNPPNDPCRFNNGIKDGKAIPERLYPKNGPHIKKPLNAFMLYMKAIRPVVLRDVPHKDSTAINQMIGKMWQSLSKEEQAYYFDLAREEREKHKLLYPDYNPRDFYAQTIKKKKKKRQREGDEPLAKKCRARFGINQQDKWCKHCKRKKKCLGIFDGDSPEDEKTNTNEAKNTNDTKKVETIF